jgi:hypothetical protein
MARTRQAPKMVCRAMTPPPSARLSCGQRQDTRRHDTRRSLTGIKREEPDHPGLRGCRAVSCGGLRSCGILRGMRRSVLVSATAEDAGSACRRYEYLNGIGKGGVTIRQRTDDRARPGPPNRCRGGHAADRALADRVAREPRPARAVQSPRKFIGAPSAVNADLLPLRSAAQVAPGRRPRSATLPSPGASARRACILTRGRVRSPCAGAGA